MSVDANLIAIFAQGAGQFAFHTGTAQKNSIDIYPLDSSNNFKVNSSLVNHVDYESHDLKSSDILYVGWCCDSDDNNKDSNSGRVKRKLDGDEASGLSSRTDNFFVNAFNDGQIVTFSSTGRDIINIVRNKDTIKAVDSYGKYIWTYDSDDCVKKLEYNKTKPVKTFHLIDGKDEEIIHFQVLKYDGDNANEDGIYLSIATEQKIYIIDPSKRRPSTVATFEVFGALSCTFSQDGKYFSVATIDTLTVYDYETKAIVRSWNVQADRIGSVKDLIFTLTIDGKISVFKVTESEPISTIAVTNSEVIDFKQISNDVMLAWLNVNEPNFKLLSIDNIVGNKEIILNEGVEDVEPVENRITQDRYPKEKIVEDVIKEEKHEKTKKISKSEQTELNVRLIKALSKENDKSDGMSVISLLTSPSWDEQRIINCINTQLTSESLIGSVLNKIIAELQNNVWTEDNTLHLWVKWIVMLKNIPHSTIYDKKPKKNMKHFKSALKSSSETLPTLLGIQGRLDLLNKQATLRQELAMLSLDDGTSEVAIEQGEDTNNIEAGGAVSNEDEDNMVYVNGENDVFVDASDFAGVAEKAA
ncbi:similar to Saccharomyces cerevisiae YHR196W UTP9 Nucleolar protein, component of the small subunit (SSU) processome containing the U3 snoRNA that is involved in processing of pre-18S rRNA [Maudiozyma barnettii]|uniref:Similar to Saccharomyces cerevisiae YHR196W UTP9 Nucleolar protein, component of the small subunit (SSU) processome containing the U3 snoRNA that is involved in processing of pre-18S rRNA n=1 Tax=Maudiozyma barnettii TaxID=61262 RepID=A0A8H2ZJG0_9SACH|nr:Utp9p [Kazachstania barnettii]CAB4256502.1 similar to Saccharomyces cerevisiae YHR196W UTP9 Nucleolar protein, component of the small subunit (SSU) processome containing the U3 snoRNA that is involved in processing of pre-18S rRNA [Kazachstania barnettii]CAD1785105.1 similar to Saccharomyces cerevisiae YHR196W UTP9 Nucleolar protein, component of the small subunit (SSU) processome containing the U3 snoRNA that is involved in processing of pre-18S rRNA [Kazachstania barnettii]